ncbi:glycosyl hydrolase 108 family protein [Paracidovorax wautersii]|uniref:glycoside hydrolase family 108 protein n=1 Tax=Paracidovorax wautersii TaxID=1177982 RepID=UPI0031E39A63
MNPRALSYIAEVIRREGGYANDPNDSGGETAYGITKAVARAYGYQGAMRDLSVGVAQDIYLQRYWIEPGFARVDAIAPALAECLLDYGVLTGQATAAKHLQRALNHLNRQGADYADVAVDGRIGTLTLSALAAYKAKRGRAGLDVLADLVESLHRVYLVELTERRQKDEQYANGWQARAGAVRSAAGAAA